MDTPFPCWLRWRPLIVWSELGEDKFDGMVSDEGINIDLNTGMWCIVHKESRGKYTPKSLSRLLLYIHTNNICVNTSISTQSDALAEIKKINKYVQNEQPIYYSPLRVFLKGNIQFSFEWGNNGQLFKLWGALLTPPQLFLAWLIPTYIPAPVI